MPLGFILGARSRRKARRATRRANDLERQRRTISNVAARRAALATLRRQQASTRALGIGTGNVDGGSAVSNAAGNIDTQTTAAVANQTQLSELDLDRNAALNRADSRSRQAGRIEAGARLGFSAAAAATTGGASDLFTALS